MNEQAKKKITPQNHLNILDLALLLLALLAAVAIWQRGNLRFFFEGDRVKSSYSVSFTVSGVHPDTAALLSADTMLYVGEGHNVQELGRLTDDALVFSHTVLMPREDGTAAHVVLPAANPLAVVDLGATFTCRGVLRDGTLVLDSGLVLAPDAEIAAFTERGEIRICIQSITENV